MRPKPPTVSSTYTDMSTSEERHQLLARIAADTRKGNATRGELAMRNIISDYMNATRSYPIVSATETGNGELILQAHVSSNFSTTPINLGKPQVLEGDDMEEDLFIYTMKGFKIRRENYSTRWSFIIDGTETMDDPVLSVSQDGREIFLDVVGGKYNRTCRFSFSQWGLDRIY